MSGRKGDAHHGQAEQTEIGRAVAVARRAGVRWKLLEGVYRRDRDTLARYARNAAQLCGKKH